MVQTVLLVPGLLSLYNLRQHFFRSQRWWTWNNRALSKRRPLWCGHLALYPWCQYLVDFSVVSSRTVYDWCIFLVCWLASFMMELTSVFHNTDRCISQNRPFYSCRLSVLAFEWMWGWGWSCFETSLPPFWWKKLCLKNNSVRKTWLK